MKNFKIVYRIGSKKERHDTVIIAADEYTAVTTLRKFYLSRDKGVMILSIIETV